jgi:sugar lactone lactonase YvrE
MCGNVCGPYANAIASCASSMCIMTCNAGFNDCNNDRMDGCEVQTSNDVNHCGRCGNVCNLPNATPVCNMGVCRIGACNAGFENADGITENGCETRVVSVGHMGTQPFSDGTINGLSVDPMTGAISPSGMVTTTTNDYLWIVNVAESTVSKWDAAMNREIARYRVGLAGGECVGRCCYDSGCNMASRVVVDGNGDAYVASRAFAYQGTVTKIAGDRANCVDRNGNGMIDTSSGPMNVLPYSAGATGVSTDECVLWTVNVGAPNAVLRSIAIDRGDAMRPNGYVWVGGYNDRSVYRLDPLDGRILNVGAPGTLGNNPYGALTTRDGRVWFTSLGGGLLQPINAVGLAPGAPIAAPVVQPLVNVPGISQYGIAADANGRLWFNDGSNIYGYDPATDRSTRVERPGSISSYSSGITVDASGNIVWGVTVAGAVRAARVPISAFTPGPNRNTPGVIPATSVTILPPAVAITGSDTPITAVGVDRRGDIWIASNGGSSRLVKIATDPARMSAAFTGPNRTYSYSDFTGSVRRTSVPQGTYSRTFDLTCASPRLGNLVVDGTFPAGTNSTLSVKTAATAAGLSMAMPIAVATLPPVAMSYDLDAIFRTAGVVPRQFVQMTIVMRQSDGGAVPIMRNFNFRWSCP